MLKNITKKKNQKQNKTKQKKRTHNGTYRGGKILKEK